MPPETNPRLVFERLFGADAHLDPAARQRRMMHRRSILDVVGARTKQLSSTPRRQRSPQGRRVPARGARDRTADRSRRERHARPASRHRQADRHSGGLCRLREADVRPAGRRVPDRPDARRHDDGRPRGIDADVPGDRRARSAPPAHAPPQQQGVDGARRADQRVPRRAVRVLHRQDEGDAGRRHATCSRTRWWSTAAA